MNISWQTGVRGPPQFVHNLLGDLGIHVDDGRVFQAAGESPCDSDAGLAEDPTPASDDQPIADKYLQSSP